MPELPEAEAARALVERHCLGRVITEVVTAEAGGGPRTGTRDDIVYEGVGHDAFERAMKGRKLVAAKRRGKQLWFLTDGNMHPAFHFGMTGSFVVQGQQAARYKSFKIDDSAWPPRFTKCEFAFEDGTRLAFVNSRRLGRIRLLDDPAAHPPISALGYDALVDAEDDEPLLARMTATSAPIKALLLDQSFTAGVGNWVADEVLYQARVHPAARARDLPEAAARALLATLRRVVRAAVAVGADSSRFPRDWLFHHRWSRSRGACKDAAGNAIAFSTVGGRTTATVPALQGASPAACLKRAATWDGAAGPEATAAAAEAAAGGGGRKRGAGAPHAKFERTGTPPRQRRRRKG